MENSTTVAKMVADLVLSQLKAMDGVESFSQMEVVTQKVLQQIGAQALEQMLAQLSPAYPSATSACSCGMSATYVRQRSTRLFTRQGIVQCKRAYYLCPSCHQGHFPLDQTLGLRPNALSVHLERLVACTGVQLPFQKGCYLFTRLTGIAVSDQTMRKATLKVGQQVADQEQQAQAFASDVEALSQPRPDKPPLRLYGAIDACKAPVRDDPQQQWRDVKLGAWFEAAACPPRSPDEAWSIRAKKISYYADIQPAQAFGSLVWSSGVARQADRARELIILGDGAAWIWNLVEQQFPDAIQILDWFHACNHLMPVAQAVFATDEERQRWYQKGKQLLWEGKVEALVTEIDQLSQQCTADVLRTTANYYETNQERMRYDFFRRQGYQIGSGTIESAAKQIGLMRLKVPGARWNVAQARLMAKARASFLTDNWESLPLAD